MTVMNVRKRTPPPPVEVKKMEAAPGEPEKPEHYGKDYMWPPGHDFRKAGGAHPVGRVGRWQGAYHVWAYIPAKKDQPQSWLYKGTCSVWKDAWDMLK